MGKLYNIGSKNPRTDKCETCTSLGQTEEEAQLKEHKEKASVAYRHLKDARNKKIWKTENFIVICIDLQKTSMIPQSNVGPHYYL